MIHSLQICNLSLNEAGGCCGGWAGANPDYGKKQFIRVLMTWDLVAGLQPGNGLTVTEKGLINDCRVGQ